MTSICIKNIFLWLFIIIILERKARRERARNVGCLPYSWEWNAAHDVLNAPTNGAT